MIAAVVARPTAGPSSDEYIPLRLNDRERKLLSVLEGELPPASMKRSARSARLDDALSLLYDNPGALSVSEYTDRVDSVMAWRGARTGRAVEELQEMLAYMTGLAVAASLKAPWQHGRRQLGAGGLKLPELVSSGESRDVSGGQRGRLPRGVRGRPTVQGHEPGQDASVVWQAHLHVAGELEPRQSHDHSQGTYLRSCCALFAGRHRARGHQRAGVRPALARAYGARRARPPLLPRPAAGAGAAARRRPIFTPINMHTYYDRCEYRSRSCRSPPAPPTQQRRQTPRRPQQRGCSRDSPTGTRSGLCGSSGACSRWPITPASSRRALAEILPRSSRGPAEVQPRSSRGLAEV